MDDDISPAPMIKIFEADEHFQTFSGERDPSFTSNCHVLLALLQRSDRAKYHPQIKKAITFLCKTWWTYDGLIKDKWVSIGEIIERTNPGLTDTAPESPLSDDAACTSVYRSHFANR